MHIAIRNDLDDEQSRILMAACDLAWRRIIQADLLTSTQQPYARNIVYAHLLRLVRRGERNEARFASRGVFLICGILACPDYEYQCALCRPAAAPCAAHQLCIALAPSRTPCARTLGSHRLSKVVNLSTLGLLGHTSRLNKCSFQWSSDRD